MPKNKDWLLEKVQKDRDSAILEQGRQEGKVSAFNEVISYFNVDKFCQVCGESNWNGLEGHFKDHPDHRPGEPPKDQTNTPSANKK